jgi:vacuolar-type H+-ATPase subunit I/STV1
LPAIQTIAKQANADGGNEVSENTENVVAEDAVAPEAAVETAVVAEATPVETAPAEDAAATDASAEILEKAADVSEVEVDEPDFAKMLGDLKGFFSDTLNKATEANAAQVSAIKETVETFSKGVDAKISELAEQHKVLSSTVSEIRSTIDGVEKRVNAVEGETAIKKSSNLGGSEGVTIKKSKWNGTFLGSVNELFN